MATGVKGRHRVADTLIENADAFRAGRELAKKVAEPEIVDAVLARSTRTLYSHAVHARSAGA